MISDVLCNGEFEMEFEEFGAIVTTQQVDVPNMPFALGKIDSDQTTSATSSTKKLITMNMFEVQSDGGLGFEWEISPDGNMVMPADGYVKWTAYIQYSPTTISGNTGWDDHKGIIVENVTEGDNRQGERYWSAANFEQLTGFSYVHAGDELALYSYYASSQRSSVPIASGYRYTDLFVEYIKMG